MRIAYFDAFSGIAGDMVLGSLLDLGLPLSVLDEQIQKLEMPGVEVRCREVHKNGIRATKADVWIGDQKEEPGTDHGAHSHSHEHSHEHTNHHSYREIHERIVAANLGEKTTEYATRIFRALAVADEQVRCVTGTLLLAPKSVLPPVTHSP